MNREVTLEEVLNQREARVHYINKLIKEYPHQSIVSFKLNIPGPIKSTPNYKWAFLQGLDDIRHTIIFEEIQLDNITGPEAYLVIHQEKDALKRSLIDIEENHPLGRLFDLDVMGISRDQLNIEPRKCLICDDDAHGCSRSRKHSIKEILDKINLIITKEQAKQNLL